MHPKSNHESEYLKRDGPRKYVPNPTTKKMGGYDVEDLAARAGINYFRMKKICYESSIPSTRELQLISLALETPFVDMQNEYKQFEPPKSI
jgi:hypothetical protein